MQLEHGVLFNVTVREDIENKLATKFGLNFFNIKITLRNYLVNCSDEKNRPSKDCCDG